MPWLISVAGVLISSREIDHLLSGWGDPVVFAFVAIESLGVPFPGETA